MKEYLVLAVIALVCLVFLQRGCTAWGDRFHKRMEAFRDRQDQRREQRHDWQRERQEKHNQWFQNRGHFRNRDRARILFNR